MEKIQIFVLIYFIVMVLLYALIYKAGVPFLLPGDIYIHKGQRRIYIPLGTTLIITLVLFLILLYFLPDKPPVEILE